MDEPQPLQTPLGEVRLRRATPREVINLRHTVLRAGLPRDSAVFSHDDDPDTRHVVAVTPDSRVVGCATVLASTWNGSPAWQMRGMATDPAFRGAGIGRALLAYVERMLLTEFTVRQMWCNARVPAIGFYERMGWHVTSEEFEVPTAGPHVRMAKLIKDEL